MKIVCISDTHSYHRKLSLPEGDVLIHAGDMTFRGEADAQLDFITWLNEQPHRHKVIIAGNHDKSLDSCDWDYDADLIRKLSNKKGIFYLKNNHVLLDGVLFYGSPYTPSFGIGWAFNMSRRELHDNWQQIPDTTDVLITHGPRESVLDKPFGRGQSVGDIELGLRMDIIKTKLHVFGHIHGSYGETESNGTKYVNASSVDEAYRLVNKPIVVEI
jgi:Icc-related predicted phosphoesterase